MIDILKNMTRSFMLGNRNHVVYKYLHLRRSFIQLASDTIHCLRLIYLYDNYCCFKENLLILSNNALNTTTRLSLGGKRKPVVRNP